MAKAASTPAAPAMNASTISGRSSGVVGGGDQDGIRRRLGAGQAADAGGNAVAGLERSRSADPRPSSRARRPAGLRFLGEDDDPADRGRGEQGPRHPAQHRLAAGADQRLRRHAVRRRESVLPGPAPRQHDRGPFPHIGEQSQLAAAAAIENCGPGPLIAAAVADPPRPAAAPPIMPAKAGIHAAAGRDRGFGRGPQPSLG